MKQFYSLDIETTGLNVRKDQVIGFSFSDGKKSTYVVHQYWDGEKLVEEIPRATCIEILYALMPHKLITFNGAFDLRFIKNFFGVDLVPSLHTDVQLLNHTVDENRPGGLKQLGAMLLSADSADEQTELKEHLKSIGAGIKEFYKADKEILSKYGRKDAELTFNLFKLLSAELEKQELGELFYGEIMPLYNEVVIPMMERGVAVDLPKMLKYKSDITVDIADFEQKLLKQIEPYTNEFFAWYLAKEYPLKSRGKVYNKMRLGMSLPEAQKACAIEANDYNFNLHSKHHLKRLFFDIMQMEPLSHTEAGQPQVDEDFLEEASKSHSWVKDLIVFNKLNKLKSTYIDRILDEQEDGIFYPEYFMHRTVSGRLSGDFQQLPRPLESGHGLLMKYTNIIREFFVARPGYSMLDDDYCLHPKSELLTKRGWVPILEVTNDDLVWQVDANLLIGNWTKPIRVVKKHYEGAMHSFGNRRGFISVTDNHTMLFTGQRSIKRPDKEKLRFVTLSQDGIPSTGAHLQLTSYNSEFKSKFDKDDIWRACAIQADGYINYKSYILEVSEPKKRERLTQLFGAGRESKFIRAGHTMKTERWVVKFNHPLLTGKFLNASLIGHNQIDDFVEALAFFDGHVTKSKTIVWCQVDEAQADLVQSVLVRHGYEAKKVSILSKNIKHRTLYSLSIRKKGRVRVQRCDYNIKHYNGPVGCVTVDSGFIQIRSDGQTFITGNCSLEPRVFSAVAGDGALTDIFKKGHDFYSTIAIAVEGLTGVSADKSAPNYLGKVNKTARQTAKSYSLGIAYGLDAFKLHKDLNISKEEAERLIKGYFDAFPKLAEWQRRSREQMLTTGRVVTRFGRQRRQLRVPEIYKRHGPAILSMLEVWKKYNEIPLLYKQAKEDYKIVRHAINNCYNHQIQGLAAHIINLASIEIARQFKLSELDAYIIGSVHDELIVEVAENQKHLAAAIVKKCMEETTIIETPLTAEPSFGYNLKDAKG